MKNHIICLFAAFGLTPVFADDGWLDAAESKQNLFQAKKGTFEVIQNKSGEQIAIVIGRTKNKLDSSATIKLEKWYVRTDDCKQGQGKIVALSIGGDFKYDNEFVFDGGNIASAKAQFICAVYEFGQEEKKKKGI